VRDGLFVILSRKRFHHADRVEHFGYYRNYFTLFLPQITRGLLDATCVGVDDSKQEWCY
jgi:hypothetical protein